VRTRVRWVGVQAVKAVCSPRRGRASEL
jgi:hypothetical protein